MGKWLVVAGIAACALGLVPAPAQAAMFTIDDFERITNNNVENVASQFSVDVLDQSSALSVFGVNIDADEVLFAFYNNVGIASSISEIYFDDGTLLGLTSVLNSLGGFTDFSQGASPPDLPGGETIDPPFEVTAGFLADAQGNPSNGIDTSSDILGIVIELLPGLGLGDVESAIDDGTLRIGLHVRSIGVAGDSDSFVNDGGFDGQDEQFGEAPEPASVVVWGTLAVGLVAGAGLCRRRRTAA